MTSFQALRLVGKNLLFTVLVPGTVGVYLPYLLMRPASPGAWWRVVTAGALFTVGAAVYGWCLWDFASFGRGTPAPIDPPQRLVVRGLYRYSRNPMYVGVLVTILGWIALAPGMALGLYWIGVASAFQLVVMFYEEPTLRRMFGEAYTEYCGRVARWLSFSRLNPRRAEGRSRADDGR